MKTTPSASTRLLGPKVPTQKRFIYPKSKLKSPKTEVPGKGEPKTGRPL